MKPAPGTDFLAHAKGSVSSRLLPVAQTVSQQLMAFLLVAPEPVSARGLGAMCRHVGARLTSLGLHFSHSSEDDIVTYVRACPNLKTLDLRGYWRFSETLLPRVAQARREVRARRPLRLRLSNISILTKSAKLAPAKHPELIIDLPRIRWEDGDVGIGEVIWRTDQRGNDRQVAVNWFYGDLMLRNEFRELQGETSWDSTR